MMPIGDPRDGFFYPILKQIMDFLYTIKYRIFISKESLPEVMSYDK